MTITIPADIDQPSIIITPSEEQTLPPEEKSKPAPPQPPVAKIEPPQPTGGLRAAKNNFGIPDDYVHDDQATILEPDPPDPLCAISPLPAEQPKEKPPLIAELISESVPLKNNSLSLEKEPAQEEYTEPEKRVKKQPLHKKDFTSFSMPEKANKRTLATPKKSQESIQKEEQKYINPKKNPVSSSLQKKINLADIARGYIYNKDGTGSDLINKEGDLSIPLSTQDVIRANYQAKMFWHVQATTRHMPDLYVLAKTFRGNLAACLRIVIAQDGSLLEVTLLQSCGMSSIDEFFLRAIRLANPYPPLPHYFPSDTFVLQEWVSLEGHQEMRGRPMGSRYR